MALVNKGRPFRAGKKKFQYEGNTAGSTLVVSLNGTPVAFPSSVTVTGGKQIVTLPSALQAGQTIKIDEQGAALAGGGAPAPVNIITVPVLEQGWISAHANVQGMQTLILIAVIAGGGWFGWRVETFMRAHRPAAPAGASALTVDQVVNSPEFAAKLAAALPPASAAPAGLDGRLTALEDAVLGTVPPTPTTRTGGIAGALQDISNKLDALDRHMQGNDAAIRDLQSRVR